jgi:hypothetical protein
MSDASTAHGSQPTAPIKPEPLFPSEGDFSTVVPLSQVARAPFTAERGVGDGRPAEADWAREDRRGTGIARRGAKAVEEEETLVPVRAGRKRAGRERVAGVGSRHGAGLRAWPVTAAAVLLSVLAGVAAGSYLVWSKRPAGSATPAADTAAAQQEVATDIPPSAPEAPPAEEPTPVVEEDAPVVEEDAPVVEEDAPAVEEPVPAAPEAPARAAAAATEAEPERPSETASRAEKVTPPAAGPATRAAAQPRPRAERPAPDTAAATPAPRPARNDAPPRRAAATAERRPTRPATSARQLPVSAPPPSSKPKTVIQWP